MSVDARRDPPAAAVPRGAAHPVLSIAGLGVRYRSGFTALDDIDLTIAPGERVGVVGPSGSGKTTLVRAVLGVLPPGSVVTGRIELDGEPLTAAVPRRLRALRGTRIGYVAQDPYAACDPVHRVRHHIAEAWTAHGQRPPADRVVADLTSMGLPDARARIGQFPHQWSGGMLQRATTLAATAHTPLLLLADEPTSALDADLADEALALLRNRGSALVLVSHDLTLVARHTDRVLVLHRGRVVEHAASRAVYAYPNHPVTRALVLASDPPARCGPDGTVAGALAAAVAGVAGVDARRAAQLPVVSAHGLTRTYPARGRDGVPVPAVVSADLRVHPGEVVGIAGRSGSGKSTLLRLVAGLERPDAGTVSLAGAPVWRPGERSPRLPRRGFVMPVFQNPVASLDSRWSLWRTLTEPLVLGGDRLPRAQRRSLARAALARVGLQELDVDRLPGSLSVGQCQRVAIARALIASPALLIADEPTASLDVEAARVAAGVLREAADRGTAVLVVSHDLARLRSYADRILTMTGGRLT